MLVALLVVVDTVRKVTERELIAKLVAKPLVASFISDAREGDLHDLDQSRRASAWAHWALNNLTELRGSGDRGYIALLLPGKFYDPRGTGPSLPPHVELPEWALDRSDSDFAIRLGQLGNAALFNWWLVPEVIALRRVLFSQAGAGIKNLVDVMAKHRSGLVTSLSLLNEKVSAQWTVIEALQAAHPENLSAAFTDPFSTGEIARIFPPAAALRMEVLFEPKFAESSGIWCSRRVGAWRITLPDRDGALGVVTPRLTSSSLFNDPVFKPESESASALLVRNLLLRRLTWRFLDGSVPDAVRPDGKPVNYYLRAIVAKVGAKLPEASVESAVNFVQQHQDSHRAWGSIQAWAADGHVITVSRNDFDAAFVRVVSCLRRAETPERSDINHILPLAWDNKSRVVRVTYSHQRDEQ